MYALRGKLETLLLPLEVENRVDACSHIPACLPAVTLKPREAFLCVFEQYDDEITLYESGDWDRDGGS